MGYFSKNIVLGVYTFQDSQQHEEYQTSMDFNGLTRFVAIGFKAEREHISAAGNTGTGLSLNYFLWYDNSPISIIPRCLCKSF